MGGGGQRGFALRAVAVMVCSSCRRGSEVGCRALLCYLYVHTYGGGLSAPSGAW